MAQAVDLLVDRRVLLDVEVARRDVRLGLVVVVVGDEVLDRVVGEERAELVAELRRERLVVGQDERRALQLLDDAGHRHRLAGAGGAQQRREAIAARHGRGDLADRLGLVGGRGEDVLELELRHGVRATIARVAATSRPQSGGAARPMAATPAIRGLRAILAAERPERGRSRRHWTRYAGTFAIAAEIAGEHHGRVTRRRLLAAGIDPKRSSAGLPTDVCKGLRRLRGRPPGALDARRLRRRGVAGGEGAKLSHAPAAHVFADPRQATAAARGHRADDGGPAPAGIVIHRVERLHPLDVTTEGIPITSVPRVLLDLAPRLSPPSWRAPATRHGSSAAQGPPTSRPASRATRTSRASRNCAARSAPTSRSATSRTPSSSCSKTTACRSRGRTSTATATRSTATGRSTTSPSSCCPTASTPAARPSSRTSRAGGARSTSPTPGATSSSAAPRPRELRQRLARSPRLAPRA